MIPEKKTHKLAESEIDAIIAEYEAGGKSRDIAARFGICFTAVIYYLKKRGIRRRHKSEYYSLSAGKTEAIRHAYASGESIEKVALSTGTTRSRVSTIIHRAKICRNYVEAGACLTPSPNNHPHGFGELTPESAYWIGFLITDGCLTFRKHRKRMQANVLIRLQESDRPHLEKFQDFTGMHTKILRVRQTQSGLASCQNSNGSWAAHFTAYCPQAMIDALMGWGIVPQKTHIASAHPALLNNRDFWRGCIDGDGSVGIVTMGSGRVVPQVKFCGASEAIVKQFFTFAQSHVGDFGSFGKGAIWFADFAGKNAIKLSDVLYSGSTISLDRKKQTADRIASLARDNPQWCNGKPGVRGSGNLLNLSA